MLCVPRKEAGHGFEARLLYTNISLNLYHLYSNSSNELEIQTHLFRFHKILQKNIYTLPGKRIICVIMKYFIGAKLFKVRIALLIFNSLLSTVLLVIA